MKKLLICIVVAFGAVLPAQYDSAAASDPPYILIDPDSVVRFGFDYDGDNRVDAYESVYGNDLMLMTRPGRVQTQPQSRRGEQVFNTLSGEIDELKQVRLLGRNQRHVIALVTTEGGQTRVVDLGPKNQLGPLRLQTGDWISVRGVQGSINRKKMLMAMQVSTDDQQVRINPPQGGRELRFAGQVKETTVRALGPDYPDRLLALVELDNEEKVVVDLGSQSMLERQDVDLSRNDKVVFLARPARFAGKDLLSATQLGVDGKTFWVGGARMYVE